MATEGEQPARLNENIGLLFGYHKDMYKDEHPSLREQCCRIYCNHRTKTWWALAMSVNLIIIGTLCTLYGYFLPSLYLSLSSDVNKNRTMIESHGNSQSHVEKEVEGLRSIYHSRDIFVIVGLGMLFSGGLILSLALLLPFCFERRFEKIPSSSRITVKNELGAREHSAANSVKSYSEETSDF